MTQGLSPPPPPARATAQSAPGNKSITASSATQMMGMAGSITPTSSGNIAIWVRGDVSASTAGDAVWAIKYGTGTAPTNGATGTGTLAGSASNPNNTASQFVPMMLVGEASGLTVGTAYWIDLSCQTTAASITGTIANSAIFAMEV